MSFVITQACVDVKDRACLEGCPADCIYEGPRAFYINPDECMECGACESACPTQAIYAEEDLPADLKEWAKINANFFAEIGNPGGAAMAGPQDHDEPTVAALPKK
ncbi:ferredoxin [Propionibacterium sp.]|uniref:ferredoxin n=1 Tax=Propionibacterium sp. TaxID=1977903 RepID=UPI0039EAB092